MKRICKYCKKEIKRTPLIIDYTYYCNPECLSNWKKIRCPKCKGDCEYFMTTPDGIKKLVSCNCINGTMITAN